MLKQLMMTAVGATLLTLGVGEAAPAATFEVLASGLDSPRGLSFGPDGGLYVTEAGRGGTGACIPSPSLPGANLCYGATGALTRILNSETERITGFPSLALPDGTDASGPHDIAWDTAGQAYVLLGLAGNPADRDSLLGIPDFGHLVSIGDFDSGASRTLLADLAGYERDNNPDGGDIISNPYAFLIQGDSALIVDAGGNDLLRVGLDGSGLTTQAVFEPRLVNNPTPVGPNPFPMQPVPTSIAIGPDGAYYVGELTGFPFPKDEARIYRLDANNQPEVYAEGFTNIIDFAFDSDSNLYVLEYATNSILSGDPAGALLRIAPDGTRTTIADDGLISPTALALGTDGAIYVANNGFVPGQGQVIRIDATSVPEPAPTVGLFVGAVGMVAWRLRKQESAVPLKTK